LVHSQQTVDKHLDKAGHEISIFDTHLADARAKAGTGGKQSINEMSVFVAGGSEGARQS